MSAEKQQIVSQGLPVFSILAAVLLVLKFMGKIAISYKTIFLIWFIPVWILIILLVVLGVIGLFTLLGISILKAFEK